MPRIHQLDIPSVFDDEDDQAKVESEKDCKEDLLTLVDDSNDELIPVSFNRATKHWISENGGLGCLANFQEVLGDIAAMTGTEISAIDDILGIQVTGRHEVDVDDALEKLSRIEKPLVSQPLPQLNGVVPVADHCLLVPH
jgi:hypothetical protein